MRLLKLALAALLVVATAVFAAGAIAERSQADTHAGPATHEEPAAGHREGGEEARAGESLRVGGNADTNEGLLGVDTESAPLIVLAVIGGLGLVAAFQPGQEFGRVLAAYGGVFIVGSLLWGVAFDGFRPDRSDVLGAGICLIGVAVIMYAR